MKWAKEHILETAALALAGLLVLVIGLASLLSGGEDDVDDVSAPTTAPPEADPETSSPPSTQPEPTEADGPEVPPIACETLLELSEIDVAMGVELADVMQRQMRGERCRTELPEYPGHWIQVEPGDPGDFDTEAEFFGVAGMRVADIGDAAVWFVGEDPQEDGVVGLLGVYKDTPLGALLYRIRIARADVSDEILLEAASGAALAALPRFPGAPLSTEPEPVEITLEEVPVDDSVFTYEGNLDVKEEAGEWTYEEGLIATLRLLTGEVPADQVLRHGSVEVEDSTVVVGLAQEQIAKAGDGASTELTRLVRLLAPTADVLEQAHESEPQGVNATPRAVRVLFVQEVDDWCLDSYGVPGGCLDAIPTPEIQQMWPDTYTLSRPRPGKVTIFEDLGVPLTDTEIGWAKESMLKSLTYFEALGKMPGHTTVLLGAPVATSGVHFDATANHCAISMSIPDVLEERHLKQGLAFFLAWCLLRDDSTHWWMQGMAMYLSGVVYPDINREHDFASMLEARELSTTLLERGYDNWLLFEFVHAVQGGHQYVYENRSRLPETVKPTFHQFALDLTNGEIADIGQVVDLVPYTAPKWTLDISGPAGPTNLAPGAWGVRRVEMTVSGGQYACVFGTGSTGDIEAGWRPGPVADSGSWSDLPAVINGTSTLVVTATGSGSFDFEVADVVEEEDDCQNQSLPEDDPSVSEACLQICKPSLYYKDPKVTTIEKDVSGR